MIMDTKQQIEQFFEQNYDKLADECRRNRKPHTFITDDLAREIVNDVYWGITRKFDYPEEMERLQGIIDENKLFNYIAKACRINATTNDNPYVRTWVKRDVGEENCCLDEPEWRSAGYDYAEDDYEMAYAINGMLTKENFKRWFGDLWEYYLDIFTDYVFTDKSYQDVADEYSSPKGTIYLHISQVKDKIRSEIEQSL